jgi:CDP-4-dehydro-6-deoxyglucose reductase
MIYQIKLRNNKTFTCEFSETIIEAALKNEVFLDHSCLTGRCSSCKFKVIKGETLTEYDESSLSSIEKSEGYILTCVRKPISDIEIEAEDLGEYGFTNSITIPAKINSIEKLTDEIIRVNFRVPTNQKFNFLAGQYLNVFWNGIKRSYSIASKSSSSVIELIIKNYQGGVMSAFWFEKARPNDLLRLEIPKGTFFLRNHSGLENLVFLATGTGIAPIKSIIESSSNHDKLNKFNRVILLWGMKYEKDIFWRPSQEKVEFISILSREVPTKQYVQDYLEILKLDMSKTVIYSCGSNNMIQDAKRICINLGLNQNHFYSDIFLPSN